MYIFHTYNLYTFLFLLVWIIFLINCIPIPVILFNILILLHSFRHCTHSAQFASLVYIVLYADCLTMFVGVCMSSVVTSSMLF